MVKIRVALADRFGVVVRLQRGVVTQTDANRLTAPVHGDQVDVDVDQKVRLGGATVDAHVLAQLCLPEFNHPVRRLAVVVVEAVGVVSVEDAPAHSVADLELLHASTSALARSPALAADDSTSIVEIAKNVGIGFIGPSRTESNTRPRPWIRQGLGPSIGAACPAIARGRLGHRSGRNRLQAGTRQCTMYL